MKNILVILFLFGNSIFAQVDLSAGMGINFFYSPSLRDYINYNYSSGGKELNDINTSVEFFGEADYSFKENYQLGIEYSYMLFSYNTNNFYFNYDLSTEMHKPSIVAYYVVNGEGFKLKFGGGIGPRIAVWQIKIYSPQEYTAVGYGFLLKAQGHTLLSDNFYANIGVDLGYDMPGDFKVDDDSPNFLVDGSNFNTAVFGIKLGVSYFF